MIKFTIKCILAASLFFFGVLVGIQKASEGIHDMKQGNIQVNVERSVDQSITKAPLSQQKKALRNIQTFNVFSAAGNVASSAVTGIFRVGVNAASSLIAKYLS